jgi:hypothetical protein
LVTATLADKASWTWTDKSEYSTQAGTTQTASLSIGGPAFGYPGPTLLEIYFDTMYQTFAFVLVSPDSRELAVAGTLTTAAGAPIERTQVKLVQKGAIKQVTVTNAKGEFRFYGRIDGPATVEADGLAPQTINRPSTPVTVALRKQLAP